MLIEFRVENHRSLREEQVMTMAATKADDGVAPRQVPGHGSTLLPVAVIYGANASGKSNVLSALAFMRDAVFDSHRFWSPDEGIPRDQFAWGPRSKEPSLFQVTVLLDGVRYEYGFVANDKCFEEEWLFAWPHGKKQVWFERDEGKFKFGENLKGENKVIEEVTRNNALFLSAAVQLKHPQLRPVYDWFRRIESHRVVSRRRIQTVSRFHPEYTLARLLELEGTEQRSLFPDEENFDFRLSDFRALLKSADVGIVDFKIDSGEEERGRSFRSRVLLKHESMSEDSWLPLDEESQGTRTLFRLALPMLDTIRFGGVLLVDELESSLHPSLARRIVEQFNDPSTNLRNAQLIFTTHDTNLLGSTIGPPVFRRDQVWLTEKDREGATVLYPLTDFRPRKSENLERGYLQGRYGAIPFLGDFSVSGE